MDSTTVKKIISTSLCPRPIGPYNQAVVIDRTVYLSGVVGADKDTGKLVPGGVVPETVKALRNIQTLLRVAGSHVDNVIKCTVLLNNINDFSVVNQEYAKGLKFHMQSSLVIVDFQFQSSQRISRHEPVTKLETFRWELQLKSKLLPSWVT